MRVTLQSVHADLAHLEGEDGVRLVVPLAWLPNQPSMGEQFMLGVDKPLFARAAAPLSPTPPPASAQAYRRLLLRLSVLRASWTPEIAAAVADDSTLNLDLALSDLTRQGLVVRDDVAREPVFSIPAPVHAALPADLTEQEGAHARYAAHFLALAEQGEAALRGPEQSNWLARFERDHDHHRAALEWTLAQAAHDQTKAALALRHAAALFPFWWRRGHHAEGLRWLEAALEHAAGSPAAVRANAMAAAANFAAAQGNHELATVRFEVALMVYSEAGDRAGAATALVNLGYAAMRRGDLGRAQARLEAAVTAVRDLGDAWQLGAALNTLGNILSRAGNLTRAEGTLQESLRLRREVGDITGVARTLSNLGLNALRAGHPERAAPYLQEALPLRRELGDPLGTAATLTALGRVALARGTHEQAGTWLLESFALAAGDAEHLADAGEALAGNVLAAGNAEVAAQLLGWAEARREAGGALRPPADEDDYARLRTAVTAQMKVDALREAWMAGQAVAPETLRSAADRALRGVPSSSLADDVRRAAHRYRALFAALPISAQVLSSDGAILEVNPAWEKFWGLTIEAHRAHVANLYEDEQLQRTGVYADFARALDGELTVVPPTLYDARFIPTGRAHWIRSLVAPVRGDDGHVTEVIILHQEITAAEREEAMRRLSALGFKVPAGLAWPLRLTAREREVLTLVAEGHPNKEIAQALSISENTVKSHLLSLMSKLCAQSRAQAVTLAMRQGLL